MSTSAPGVRGALTRPVRLALTGMLLSSLGSGLTLSLLIVYLSSVRGIATAVAGLVLSWIAVVGLAISPLAGAAVDRVGARPVLMVALGVESVGTALLVRVDSVASAFAVGTVVAVGAAVIWPAQSALLASLTEEGARQRVFGVQFMMVNLGLGIGGLAAASVVDIARPSTFETLYLVDAATFCLYIALLVWVRAPRPVPEPHESQAEGYRAVLADRRLRRLALAGLVLVTFGYGSLDGGLAAYITQSAGLPVSVVGVVFAVNTGVIVLAQWFVLGRVEGRSRSATLAVVGVLWGLSWAVMGASGLTAGAAAVVVLCLGMVVFALAETLWSPMFPSLLNRLAPDRLRGRYNAVGSWTWNVGGALGPALAGALIGAGAGGWWVVLLVVGCLLGGAAMLRLRPLLTPDEDGRGAEAVGVGGSRA